MCVPPQYIVHASILQLLLRAEIFVGGKKPQRTATVVRLLMELAFVLAPTVSNTVVTVYRRVISCIPYAIVISAAICCTGVIL